LAAGKELKKKVVKELKMILEMQVEEKAGKGLRK